MYPMPSANTRPGTEPYDLGPEQAEPWMPSELLTKVFLSRIPCEVHPLASSVPVHRLIGAPSWPL